ncbi:MULTISPECIES: NlpC/P60 family protein [Sulfurimonas]|uniref:NlpC/P60 family protein n=1 Tax=Sulfurimonas TaxID=202746 RepID=UPI00126593E4|nr:NlpC/P60 family protein [Sulfurimonas indica]
MKQLLVFLAVFLLSSCSSSPKPYKKISLNIQNKPSYNLENKNHITKKLYESYEKWAGVKYCYGGESKSGIDCSALVQTIYKEAFHIELPRTTKEQIKVGKKVQKKALKEGDILFFKTSYHVLHSGIYLKKGAFIHASSKYGVILSNIHNPYWRAKYFQARRVLF